MTLLEEVSEPSKGKICVLLTGGTICMCPTDHGYEVRRGYLVSRMAEDIDFCHTDIPDYEVYEWDNPIDSSQMSQSHWLRIARDIERHYFDYTGFVICHGTDTMAYTASALSFILENLGKPVIVTGSQIPMSGAFSDAKTNLIGAMIIAGSTDISEVCLVFNGQLFRGNRVTKFSTESTNAFLSPNLPALGRLESSMTIENHLLRRQPAGRFRVWTHLKTNIAVLDLIPNESLGLYGLFFDAIINQDRVIRSENDTNNNNDDDDYRAEPSALILRLFGLGHYKESESLINKLRQLRKKDVEIILMSQCQSGTVDPFRYGAGLQFRDIGAIVSLDMTLEACFTKLAYLLGKGLSGQELSMWMNTDIQGEVSPQSQTQSLRKSHIRGRFSGFSENIPPNRRRSIQKASKL